MMDSTALVYKLAMANQRIELALTELTEKYGFLRAAEEIRNRHADPEIAALRRTEGIADLLETLLEEIGRKNDHDLPDLLDKSGLVQVQAQGKSAQPKSGLAQAKRRK
jgi:hypothetical protein